MTQVTKLIILRRIKNTEEEEKKEKKRNGKKTKKLKKHKTEAAVDPSDLSVPIDKLKNMECTFSYSSKK